MNKNKLEKMIQDKTERDIKNARIVFNEANIRKEKLIEKALGDPRCAYCWLVVVWQSISFWRRSDINRIPVINLPWDRDDIAMHIREGDWNAYANEAAVKLESTINSGNLCPTKTGVGKLTIHIANPLREIVGLVYLIAYYHASDGRIHSYKLTNREYDYIFGRHYRIRKCLH